jgi:2,4-dienoyl-CoA reductase-like NADH-dependent reductase (Old Yellow Enzyme family)
MSALFAPLTIRELTFRNRIAVSPMCQYSSEDGFANDWHLVHLGSRAVGGAALVIMEASAVEARGRISPQDHGIWKDEHIPFLARIAAFLRQQGAAACIQLAHAGRKASTWRPWEGSGAVPPEAGGWQPVAPSPIAFQPDYPLPRTLTLAEIAGIGESFAAAARRALEAGFQVVELHFAHGYLMHEFLSPLSNRRTDEYGGPFENRIRFAIETAKAVRAVWPEHLPLFVRISASDWVEGGWDIDESVELSRRLCSLGVDLIDCSSGGLAPQQKIKLAAGLSSAVRRAHSSRSRHSDGRRRTHHYAATGRRDRQHRKGRPGAAGARIPARSLFPLARRQGARGQGPAADPISARVLGGEPAVPEPRASASGPTKHQAAAPKMAQGAAAR